LIALLFALVIAVFFVSRRAGMVMLAGVSVAVTLMLAWAWYSGDGPETQRDAIPVEQVEIVDTRMRGNTEDYLVQNHDERWTLTAIHSDKTARLEDGTVVDRKKFVHRVNVPPQQARWETLRFFGLEIGLEYDWRITGTEGSRERR
jgi:membrane protein implicated in regulation of membrane protease activity